MHKLIAGAALACLILVSGCKGSETAEAGAAAAVAAAPTASVSATLPTPQALPAPTVKNAFIWGANGHPITAYPDITLDSQLKLLKELGVTHYRINTRGDGSAEALDRIAQEAAAYGITIIPILQPNANLDSEAPAQLYAKSYDLGRTMAARFKGRFPVWELGNEMEIYALLRPCEFRDDGTKYPCEWGIAGGVEASEYHGGRWRKVSAVLDGLSDGVRSADARVRRAIGSAGWGHSGMFDRMAADKIDWEISVWHDYDRDAEWAFKRLQKFGKPIWVTEFNDGGGGLDPQAQADGAAKKARDYRRWAGAYKIEAAFVYELLDEPYWTGFESRMGLVRMQRSGNGPWTIGAKKPAFEALRAAIASN
jgi:hypothetical protein